MHIPKLIVMKKIFIQALLLASGCANVAAENLNFSFQNPSFLGGNPNNAAGLLNLANAQNPFKAPVETAAEKAAKSYETAVFSKINAKLLEAQFGTDSLVAGDSFDTRGFNITVANGENNQLVVTAIDKVTGDKTTFTVDGQ
jgi:hypothetical protein